LAASGCAPEKSLTTPCIRYSPANSTPPPYLPPDLHPRGPPSWGGGASWGGPPSWGGPLGGPPLGGPPLMQGKSKRMQPPHSIPWGGTASLGGAQHPYKKVKRYLQYKQTFN
jgi:hypothetical protein